MNLFAVAQEITRRPESMFLGDQESNRPLYGGAQKFQKDPHWRDYILFYEYFHGGQRGGIGCCSSDRLERGHCPSHGRICTPVGKAGSRLW